MAKREKHSTLIAGGSRFSLWAVWSPSRKRYTYQIGVGEPYVDAFDNYEAAIRCAESENFWQQSRGQDADWRVVGLRGPGDSGP